MQFQEKKLKVIQKLIDMRNSIQEAFLEDVKKIKKTCIEFLGDKINVFFYGSYGANQGGWIKIKDEYFPYNDYDILIVSDIAVKNKDKLIKLIKTKILEDVKIKFIDITIKSKKEVTSLKSTVENYDILNASKHIFGEYDFRKYVEKIDKKDLSLEEVEKLFFTRLWIFSGAITSYEKDKTFRLTQIAKALFAIVDSILINKKNYESIYVQKKEKIRQFLDDESFMIIDWALKQRSLPKDVIEINNTLKYDEEYLTMFTAKMYRLYFLKLLSKKYNKSFQNINDFRKFYICSFKVRMKQILYPLIKRKSYSHEIIKMNAFMVKLSLILGEISENEGKNILLKNKLLINDIESSCDELCYKVARS